MAFSKSALLMAMVLGLSGSQSITPSSEISYLSSEITYLNTLNPRLTGSPNHNLLIAHIEHSLQNLNLTVCTDHLNITYFDLLAPPSLSLNNTPFPLTSLSKYSGFTSPDGVTAPLIDLTAQSKPIKDWNPAKDSIALTSLLNTPESAGEEWPDAPPFPPLPGSPNDAATTPLAHLSAAAHAGVKGVLVAWQNVSTVLAEGQYAPLRNLYQGVPTLFVQGSYGGLERLQSLARQNATANLTLNARMVPRTPTRTLWVVFEGTELRNESFVVNTHTDGTNVVEENGWICLLAYAAQLKAHPPRRTTILVFTGQHFQQAAVAVAPGRAMTRWLTDHVEYWVGSGDTQAFEYGGQLKAVAGTAVEHLGAVYWEEDLANDTYTPTDITQPENLYASTAQLNELLRRHWRGADPNVTRVLDPDTQDVQGGEGEALLQAGIPEISLVTNPAYLLKIWPDDFDQSRLVDLRAMQRQIDSFLAIWELMDGMSAADFGTAPAMTL